MPIYVQKMEFFENVVVDCKVFKKFVEINKINIEIRDNISFTELKSLLQSNIHGGGGQLQIECIYSKRKKCGKEVILDIVDEIIDTVHNGKSHIFFLHWLFITNTYLIIYTE